MNNNINFIKNIDNLGRVVIPMDIRRKLNINTGDVLSIRCTESEINLSKYSSLDNNKKIYDLIDLFIETFNINIILTNKELVKHSNIIPINTKLNNDIRIRIKNGNTMQYTNNSINFDDNIITGEFNMLPIITNEGIIGSLITIGNKNTKAYEICHILSKIIMLYLNIS